MWWSLDDRCTHSLCRLYNYLICSVKKYRFYQLKCGRLKSGRGPHIFVYLDFFRYLRSKRASLMLTNYHCLHAYSYPQYYGSTHQSQRSCPQYSTSHFHTHMCNSTGSIYHLHPTKILQVHCKPLEHRSSNSMRVWVRFDRTKRNQSKV